MIYNNIASDVKSFIRFCSSNDSMAFDFNINLNGNDQITSGTIGERYDDLRILSLMVAVFPTSTTSSLCMVILKELDCPKLDSLFQTNVRLPIDGLYEEPVPGDEIVSISV